MQVSRMLFQSRKATKGTPSLSHQTTSSIPSQSHEHTYSYGAAAKAYLYRLLQREDLFPWLRKGQKCRHQRKKELAGQIEKNICGFRATCRGHDDYILLSMYIHSRGNGVFQADLSSWKSIRHPPFSSMLFPSRGATLLPIIWISQPGPRSESSSVRIIGTVPLLRMTMGMWFSRAQS